MGFEGTGIIYESQIKTDEHDNFVPSYLLGGGFSVGVGIGGFFKRLST